MEDTWCKSSWLVLGDLDLCTKLSQPLCQLLMTSHVCQPDGAGHPAERFQPCTQLWAGHPAESFQRCTQPGACDDECYAASLRTAHLDGDGFSTLLRKGLRCLQACLPGFQAHVG